jgi:hypothetical protein
MTDIVWNTQDKRVDKADLQAGILQWVRQQTGIANASLSYLHSLTIDDLTLIAMAVGFKPPEMVERNVRAKFRRRAIDNAKHAAADAVRYGRPIPLPAPEC